MALVSPELLTKHLQGSERLAKAYALLASDREAQGYLRMANVMAVGRLKYNDHGPVHSRIVAGSALEILSLLVEGGVEPSVVADGVGDLEDAKLVTLMGAYLHDIGNAVHRDQHYLHACYIAKRILDRVLRHLYGSSPHRYAVEAEILHCVFAHDDRVEALSIEAGVVKVADGTDMAEGRARIPYRTGKVDVHSLSALAIKSVEVERGVKAPVCIKVDMDNPAGIFQVELVLGGKIKTSSIKQFLEVEVLVEGRRLKTMNSF